jgi:hypothetical protein
MNLLDAPQGSDAWLLARCGRATASEFCSVLAKGQGKTRAAYLRRVLSERLTGKPTEGGYRNAHMDRGNEQEPFARMAYEAKSGNLVEECGFIQHPTLMAGCSPDGLVDADGGAEIKSVIPTVQLDTILSGSYPSEHQAQIQGSLWITGRSYWDFVSFSPDMPEHLRLYVFRVKRDDGYIKTLAAEVVKFLAEVDELYLESLMKKAA